MLIARTLITQIVFYKVYPKSTYMVKHLNTVEQKVRNPNTLKFISQCKTWIINRDMPSNVPQSFQKLTEAMDKQRSTKLTELDSRFKEYL